MAKLKKTAREKLNEPRQAQVEVVGPDMARKWGEGTVVIPAPLEVNEVMRSVPEGKLISVNMIRDIMAKRYKATYGCPLTTGIFIGLAAKASAEDEAEGRMDITPYWRTLKGKGELNEKYPGGREEQAARLIAEGHEIEEDQNGNPKRVRNWEKKLVNI